jgi:hypothetical protein
LHSRHSPHLQLASRGIIVSFVFGEPVVSPARLKNPNPTGFQWFVTDYLFSGSFSRPVCRPARISEIVR